MIGVQRLGRTFDVRLFLFDVRLRCSFDPSILGLILLGVKSRRCVWKKNIKTVQVLIIANGIMIGFQTSPQYEDWDGWIYLELTFIIFLLLEMGLRIRLLRCKNYWCGADRLWNFFDCFLALSGIADIAVQAFSHQNPDLPATSLLRFCRLIRQWATKKWKNTCRGDTSWPFDP